MKRFPNGFVLIRKFENNIVIKKSRIKHEKAVNLYSRVSVLKQAKLKIFKIQM